MVVSILTRTEASGRRIIEGVYVDDENETSDDKAKRAKNDLIKRYRAPSSLCMDIEIDTREAE